jgi:hypothetical protein
MGKVKVLGSVPRVAKRILGICREDRVHFLHSRVTDGTTWAAREQAGGW